MNEILWLIFAIVNFGLIILSYKLFGKIGLFAWIVFGTVIANIQVTKQIELFGMGATLGNIMYGTLFLATDALGELFGKKTAKKSVFIGFFIMLATIVIMQIALKFTPNEFDGAQSSLETIFSLLPRIALGSILAYIVSQNIDIFLFEKIKRRFPSNKYLWLRNNGSTLLSQLIDTIVFVPIAFLGAEGYPTEVVFQIFVSTYIIKVIVSFLDTPFLYLMKQIKPLDLFQEDTYVKEEK